MNSGEKNSAYLQRPYACIVNTHSFVLYKYEITLMSLLIGTFVCLGFFGDEKMTKGGKSTQFIFE